MKKSVLIVGGGIAGLSAARSLLHHGFSVTVLEAKERLGGRILTLRHQGVPIELGAEFVHGESRPLLENLREAQLTRQPVSGPHLLFANGHLDTINLWERTTEIFNRFDPARDDIAFNDFLLRQPDLDDQLCTLIRHQVEGFNAADASRISTKALLCAEHAAEQMNGSHQSRVTTGYSDLVDFIAQDIERSGGMLIQGARVRQVSWEPHNVNILVNCNHRLEEFKSDAAVITLPVGVLKTGEVAFQPSLPGKTEAARGLEYGNVVKIIFQFQNRFWDDFAFIHAPEKLIPTWWPDPRGPILVGWAAGPHADALFGFSHSKLQETGLEILSAMLSRPKEFIAKQLMMSHYWDWAKDPYSGGAYSYIPVNKLELPRNLAEPVEETLFFAGEATVADAQTGTVFGALESGLRAAQEILNSTRTT